MVRWSPYARAIPSAATWRSTRSTRTGAFCPRRPGCSSSSSPRRLARSLTGTSPPVPDCVLKNESMDLAKATLDDKYTQETGRVFLTGTQALIRVMLLQRERDLRAGLNTAGFVSGYRGSPLGGLDQALWRAQKHLATHHVKFQ